MYDLYIVPRCFIGAVSRTATSPLERLKVMQQVQSSTVQPYKGIWSGLTYMYKHEGPKSFFKGNGANVARIAPYSALQFMFFDLYKNIITRSTGVPEGSTLSPYWKLTAGALAGSTSTLFCYPLDLVRSYLTVQTDQARYRGITHTLISIYQAEGVRGLFRGSLATLAGITPYIALNFFAFDTLKRNFLPPLEDPSFVYINLALGGTSGAFAALMTYPTDVIRRKIQLQGLGKGMVADMPQYKGIVDCVMTVCRTEGVRGLYRGLGACLLKVTPSMAISFSIHEQLRQRLRFDYK
jgi:solute carrier family 25 phosphate transporter 23/24/25/41